MSSLTWDTALVAPSPRPRAVAGRPRPVAAAPAAASGLRLTRRGRLTVTVLALLLAGGVGLSAQRAAADGPVPAVAVEARTVVAGETLWSIASSLADPGQDVRDVVDALAELNGLEGSGLAAGQQLLVPAAD